MTSLFLTMTAVAALTFIPLGGALAQTTPYNEMPAGVYNLDETHAQLVWQVSHLGLSNYTARFTDFDADLIFDPEKPENSQLIATIDPTSIKTDFPYTESYLQKLESLGCLIPQMYPLKHQNSFNWFGALTDLDVERRLNSKKWTYQILEKLGLLPRNFFLGHSCSFLGFWPFLVTRSCCSFRFASF